MAEYFDDDELINDYMEEDEFEPPPDYDDAFMEEVEQQQQQRNAGGEVKEPASTASQQPSTTAISTSPAPTEPPPEVTTATEPFEEDNAAALEWRDSRETKDLYKFERFHGMNDWRKKPKNPSDTMAANSWKKQSSLFDDLLGGDNDNKGTTSRSNRAPEVQLVEFLNKTSKQQVVISKAIGKKYLKPKEGVDSVAVTLADGTRIHAMRQTLNHKEVLSQKQDSGNILGISMRELMRRSDAIRRKADRRKRMRANVEGRSADDKDDDTEEPDTLAMLTEQEEKSPESCSSSNHQLWVDKHAPTIFSHLLSDERTNREVLRALRAWDPYVFHRDPPPRPTSVQQFQQKQQQHKKSPSSPNKTNGEETPKNPKDTRPDECNRVLLLSGPPGVGKTTLAHIVATHAGYRPMEVNSSDERSASVLKERVVRAMESSTLNLKTDDADSLMGRPNCLILDEIDGADAKGAVAALVDIIRAEMPTKSSNKKQKNTTYLRRPIIFICNHKYAPALRPLLPYARQFDVSPPSPTRLVARLRSVLSMENLSLMGGSALLHQLVAGAGGDIRSCLYTLQFASARAREMGRSKRPSRINDASTVDISKALGSALGTTGGALKDERNDVAGTITAIFRKLKLSRQDEKSSNGQSKKNSVDRVLRAVESFGDNSKTLDCLFTNLLRVSYVDPTLDRCFAAHEWLSGADVYRSSKTSVASNNSSEHFSIQRSHIPSAAAAVHLLCRVETRADLLFSTRQMVDSRYQLESNTGLIHKFVEGLSPKSRAGAAVGIANVVTETIPYSLWMLSAGEGSCSLSRAVSSIGILNNHERLAFDAHVETLRALGLTYVPEETGQQQNFRSEESNSLMRLEPQIDRVVQFEELSGQHKKEIPSVLKELLAHSANLEGMREREAVAMKKLEGDQTPKQGGTGDDSTRKPLFKKSLVSASKTPGDTTSKHKMQDKVATEPPSKRPKTTTAPTNFLGIGAARAKAAKSRRKAALVGFDRSKKAKLSNTGSGVEFKNVIRFKFSRGFTQAVRTPCKLEDLM